MFPAPLRAPLRHVHLLSSSAKALVHRLGIDSVRHRGQGETGKVPRPGLHPYAVKGVGWGVAFNLEVLYQGAALALLIGHPYPFPVLTLQPLVYGGVAVSLQKIKAAHAL